MRHAPGPTLTLLLTLLPACGAPAERDPAGAAPDAPVSVAAAAGTDALDAMLAGEWSLGFPAVAWTDVPALLARADSRAPLPRFPVNPLSSQRQDRCDEATMALWMIEGLRRDLPLGYPSLNPLLLGRDDPPGADWQERSDTHLLAAAEAYRAWWRRAADRAPGTHRADDPLAGTGLAWH